MSSLVHLRVGVGIDQKWHLHLASQRDQIGASSTPLPDVVNEVRQIQFTEGFARLSAVRGGLEIV